MGEDGNIDAIGAFAIVEETLNLTTEFIESGVTGTPVIAAIDGPVGNVADAAATSVEQGVPLVLGPTALAVGLRALVEDARAQHRRDLPTVQAPALADTRDAAGLGLPLADAATGTRLIAEARRDDIFGVTVALGLGGEGAGDEAVRVAPVVEGMAREMVGEFRGAELLLGADGEPTFDTARVEQLLAVLAVSLEGDDALVGLTAELDLSAAGELRVTGLHTADRRVLQTVE